MTDDRGAIENLLYAYAECVDRGDFDGVADLFAHATYASDHQPARPGREFVRTILRTLVILYEDGTPRTQHVVTNPWIEVDAAAGTASARSRYTVLQALPDRPAEVVVAGRYRDRFERVDGRWRFASRP